MSYSGLCDPLDLEIDVQCKFDSFVRGEVKLCSQHLFPGVLVHDPLFFLDVASDFNIVLNELL